MRTQFYISCFFATCLIAGVCGRSTRYPNLALSDKENGMKRKKMYTLKAPRRSPEEVVAMARQHAIQVIVEKMFRALGQDFPKDPNVTVPLNEALPTVSNVNITTEPCPDIYTICSSESFLPSCNAPNGSSPTLWRKMFNLYFDLPEDLFVTDTLLNATLQLYKNKTLPLDEPTMLNVELYAYTNNATRRREFITSTNVTSDYIGWVTLDLTDLITNLHPDNNHGFHIKVKEFTGIYWSDLHTFVSMDCSDQEQNFLSLPLGVQTDQPEQKFPSVNIRTGTTEHQYPELVIDPESQEYYYDDSYPQSDNFVYDDDGMLPFQDNEMPGDDPNVPETATSQEVQETEELPEIHLAPKRISQSLSPEFGHDENNRFSNFVDDANIHSDYESMESIQNDYNSWPYFKTTQNKRHNRHNKHYLSGFGFNSFDTEPVLNSASL